MPSGPLPSGLDGPDVLPSRMTPAQTRCVGISRASYQPFRVSFFFDPRANTALKKGGRQPNQQVYARESRRMWTSHGPRIDSSLPKTTVKPGTAFRNECLSADQLYSSSRNTMGYDVHRSLRGTSLCGTTKRFSSKSATPECVGPGSYDVMKKPKGLLTDPPPRQQGDFRLPDRLAQWDGRPDSRSMDSAGEWKSTSEIPSVTKFSFRKARAGTWIDQIEQRQRREDPLARQKPEFCVGVITPEQRLPQYLQGTSNPVHTSKEARRKPEIGLRVILPEKQGTSDPVDTNTMAEPSKTPSTSDLGRSLSLVISLDTLVRVEDPAQD